MRSLKSVFLFQLLQFIWPGNKLDQWPSIRLLRVFTVSGMIEDTVPGTYAKNRRFVHMVHNVRNVCFSSEMSQNDSHKTNWRLPIANDSATNIHFCVRGVVVIVNGKSLHSWPSVAHFGRCIANTLLNLRAHLGHG